MYVPSPYFLFDESEKRRLLTATGVELAMSVLLACVLGCGSGALSKGPQQNLAAPIASASGPQLGYLWQDSDHTLRPILGLPGASQIGQSVVPKGVYINAVTSASAGIAVLQQTGGTFDVMRLPSGPAAGLGVAFPAGARIRLSPSATFALLYTPGATSASLVTGLQSSPQLQSISAAAPIGDSGVSDTGTIGLELVEGSLVSIAITPFGGRSTPIATIRAAGGMSFIPGRDDLLVADADANTLTLIRNASNAPSIQLVQAAGQLKTPSALGVSSSGRWAVIANSGEQSLVRVDLASLVGIAIPCSCKPTLAEPLADDGAFRVTALASAANWLIDAKSTAPRMMFIPASRTPTKDALASSTVQP